MLKTNIATKWYAGVVIVALVIVLTSCNNSKSNFIGKWQNQDKKQIILEFFDNNTFAWNNIFRSGQWEMLKDGRIQIRPIDGTILVGIMDENELRIDTKQKMMRYKKLSSKDIQEAKANIYATWQTTYYLGAKNAGERIKMIETITFNKDFSYIHKITIPNRKDEPVKYNYKFIDDTHIETETGITFTIKKISSDELVLYRDDKQKDIVYSRVSP